MIDLHSLLIQQFAENTDLFLVFQRQDIIEEVQQREEILKMEAKKRKDIRRSSENADDLGNNG